jgi:hypothetical protein
MTKPMIVIVACVAMNAAAQSQTTGDQWIALCSKGASATEHASCESYARGVADAVFVAQRVSPELPPACIPAAARHVVAAALLMDAFRDAFPCPRK